MQLSNLKAVFILVLLGTFTFGCDHHEAFNSEKWKSKEVDWWLSDVREKMIDDLLSSGRLSDRSRLEIVEILGVPEVGDSTKAEYLIREKYGKNIDPDYISYLLITYNMKGYSVNIKVEKK